MKKYLYILILIVLIGITVNTQTLKASVVNPDEPCNAPTNPTNLPCIYGTTPAGSNNYHLLAPIKIDGGIEDFDPGQENALGSYLNLMIKIFIGLCAVLAVVMLVIGGIEYMTSELASSKESARSRMTGAVFGLVIALGAYAILFTINPDLLQTDLDSLTQATIEVSVEDTPQAAINGQYASANKKYLSGANWAQVSGASSTPLPPGVSTNRGECATVGQQNCTSLLGLQIGYVRATQQGCNCPIVINGGTESWLHKAGTGHEPGSAVVDLATDGKDPLTKYIVGGSAKPVHGQRYTQGGVSYLYEGNHWHVGG